MNKADVQAAFVKAGLSRLVRDIDDVTQSSIRLSATPVGEYTIEVGASKLGGVPDLPANVGWPAWKGAYQSFIGQISLAEVHPYDTDRLLPQSGILWFFYDSQQQTYGADPADRGGWLVFFAEDTSLLQRVQAPPTLPATSQFRSCSLSFANEISLSQQPQIDVPNFDWTADEQKKYENLLATLPATAPGTAPRHQLLGLSDSIQDDVRLQCQLVSNGVTDSHDPRFAELSQGAKNWQLLLQVDSDENVGMQWGSTGMLYYGIKKADLQAKDFNNTWLVLQSE